LEAGRDGHATGRADGLLDSYHAERHPVAARVLATVRAQGVIMNLSPRPTTPARCATSWPTSPGCRMPTGTSRG
jgi:hypothetical protein